MSWLKIKSAFSLRNSGDLVFSEKFSLRKFIFYFLSFSVFLALVEVFSFTVFELFINWQNNFKLIDLTTLSSYNLFYSWRLHLNVEAYFLVALLAGGLFVGICIIKKDLEKYWTVLVVVIFFPPLILFVWQIFYFLAPNFKIWALAIEIFIFLIIVILILTGKIYFKNRMDILIFLFFLSGIFITLNLIRTILLEKNIINYKNLFLLVGAGLSWILFSGIIGFFLLDFRAKSGRILRILLSGIFLAFSFFIFINPLKVWLKLGVRSIMEEKTSKKNYPDIIMVVWDTVRADHLSLYGYERKTTPFLNYLASQALVFKRAFASASWTIPSHASFFTGLYPSQHNCHHENLKLASRFDTLAEKLQRLGYINLGYSNNILLDPNTGLSQGFDRFIINFKKGHYLGEAFYLTLLYLCLPEVREDSGAFLTEKVIKKWLRRLKKREVPFFLFINYMEAHTPYPWTGLAFQFFEHPEKTRRRFYHQSVDWDYFICRGRISKSAQEGIIKWYDGAIYYLDWHLSRLFNYLSELGLLDNTIVVILSDHGEYFGEHNLFEHSFGLHQNILWVPLLFYFPQKLKPQKISKPISLIKVPDIILRLIQGENFSQIEQTLLTNSSPVFAETFFPYIYIQRLWRQCPGNAHLEKFYRRQKAIIRWPYKLIWDSKGKDELYHLENDPKEFFNLIKQKPEIYFELKKQIDIFQSKYPTPKAADLKMDLETRQIFKSIGYLK